MGCSPAPVIQSCLWTAHKQKGKSTSCRNNYKTIGRDLVIAGRAILSAKGGYLPGQLVPPWFTTDGLLL